MILKCEDCDERTADTYEYPDGTTGIYCPTHARDHGFCFYCGGFWAGVESFQMNSFGICYDCNQEIEDEFNHLGEED